MENYTTTTQTRTTRTTFHIKNKIRDKNIHLEISGTFGIKDKHCVCEFVNVKVLLLKGH